MSEKLETVGWATMQPNCGVLFVDRHEPNNSGGNERWSKEPVVLRAKAESLLSERDATIAKQAEEIEHLKRIIFTNTDRSMTMSDRFFVAQEGGFISDENFDFDAGLQVSGDFVDDEKAKYAQMITCTLNDYRKQAERIARLEEALGGYKLAQIEQLQIQADQAQQLAKQASALELARARMVAAKNVIGWDEVPYKLHVALDALFDAIDALPAAGQAWKGGE